MNALRAIELINTGTTPLANGKINVSENGKLVGQSGLTPMQLNDMQLLP